MLLVKNRNIKRGTGMGHLNNILWEGLRCWRRYLQLGRKWSVTNSKCVSPKMSSGETSLTRFGEIPPLWQIFKNIWQYNFSLFGFEQSFQLTLAQFVCCWANLIAEMAKYWKYNLVIWSHWARNPFVRSSFLSKIVYNKNVPPRLLFFFIFIFSIQLIVSNCSV